MEEYFSDLLYIYPVKSIAGISVKALNINERGLEFDRFWMLVNENYQMLSQRDFPKLNLLKIFEDENSFKIQNPSKSDNYIEISKNINTIRNVEASIWDQRIQATLVDFKVSHWFSEFLNAKVLLLANALRLKTKRINEKNHELQLNFQDGYPVHLVNLKSVTDLSKRCKFHIEPERFRANIYIDLPEPYYEDEMKYIRINGIEYEFLKPCERCIMINLKSRSSLFTKEPLKTLSTYRLYKNKIRFGSYIKPINTINF
ncbi:MAG: MOSC N-terminal beta barrel domain-containing protein [Saprospiraceae bacterium]|nr:MOSC N-terminal beta barrel domain-containing protein [Saprospiraceae bacterium]